MKPAPPIALQVDRAKELCIRSGHHWRAVTLDGWKLRHDPNLAADATQERQPVRGNAYRDVWKVGCHLFYFISVG